MDEKTAYECDLTQDQLAILDLAVQKHWRYVQSTLDDSQKEIIAYAKKRFGIILGPPTITCVQDVVDYLSTNNKISYQCLKDYCDRLLE